MASPILTICNGQLSSLDQPETVDPQNETPTHLCRSERTHHSRSRAFPSGIAALWASPTGTFGMLGFARCSLLVDRFVRPSVTIVAFVTTGSDVGSEQIASSGSAVDR
jgi:hypothetical protein